MTYANIWYISWNSNCFYHLYIHLLFPVSFKQTYNINELKWSVHNVSSYFIYTISDFLRTHNFMYTDDEYKIIITIIFMFKLFIRNWLQFFGICIDVKDVNRVNHKCYIFHIKNSPEKFFYSCWCFFFFISV